MKRILSALLILILCVGLCACGSTTEAPSAPAEPETTTEDGDDTIATPAETPVDAEVTDDQNAVAEEPAEEDPLAVGANLISIRFAEDGDVVENYFAQDVNEYSTDIIFTAQGHVKDFTFFGITLEDVDDNGAAIYQRDTIWTNEELAAGESFMISMDLPEIIPLYGFSYTDGEDVTYLYSINQSGKDGSLLLEDWGTMETCD